MPLQDTLETALEHSVQELYLQLFNHSLSRVTCRCISHTVVALVLENSTTLVEQVLLRGDRIATAQAFRHHLNLILEHHLMAMFSQDYQCSVSDIMSQHQPDARCISMLIVVENASS